MKSLTKNYLSNEQVIRLVKANFGEKTLVKSITELCGGLCNAAYLIECINKKEKIVLKVSMSQDAPLLWHEGDNMYSEIEAYKLVSENTTVPLPKILCYDFSRNLINSRYFFMEYLTGQSLKDVHKEITVENMLKIKCQLADYISQIHKINGSYFGYITTDESRKFITWRKAYEQWFERLFVDIRKHKYKIKYKRIKDVLLKAYELLDEIKEPRLIHNDFFAGNVFVEYYENEYKIQGIIDFERAAWGDPLAEFHVNGMIIGNIWDETQFWKCYIKKNKEKSELSKEDIARIHIYKLYVWLIMVAETYRYPSIYGIFQRFFSRIMAMKSVKALEAFFEL